MDLAASHLDPPPGFVGVNWDEQVNCYERHLPHWRQDGVTCFVTFRVADSLPVHRLRELREIKVQWQRELGRIPELTEQQRDDQWRELARMTYEKSEKWLDQGMGASVFRSGTGKYSSKSKTKNFQRSE